MAALSSTSLVPKCCFLLIYVPFSVEDQERIIIGLLASGSEGSFAWTRKVPRSDNTPAFEPNLLSLLSRPPPLH